MTSKDYIKVFPPVPATLYQCHLADVTGNLMDKNDYKEIKGSFFFHFILIELLVI